MSLSSDRVAHMALLGGIHRSSRELLKKLEGKYHCKSKRKWDLLIRVQTKLPPTKNTRKCIHL